MKVSNWYLIIVCAWAGAGLFALLAGIWQATPACVGAMLGAMQCVRYARTLEEVTVGVRKLQEHAQAKKEAA